MHDQLMLYLGIAMLVVGVAGFFFPDWVIKKQGTSKGKWSYTEEQRKKKLLISGIPLMLGGIVFIYLYFFG